MGEIEGVPMKHPDNLKNLTLEQKVALLSGKDVWSTYAFPQAGVPSMVMSDGPHGLRRQLGRGDHLGQRPSQPATCFPTAACLAGSWDPALLEEVGRALGREAAAQGVHMLLGPGMNLKRSPLGGRNFEYFSEDPYLSGKLAAALVRGVQSQGAAACIKHFAANSQELLRMTSDSVVDERTFRELYLTGFEIAVKEGRPLGVMSSYNRVNGAYANENPHLLTEILREEWGFTGMVVTDWFGGRDAVGQVQAGNDLLMPGKIRQQDSIRQALKTGKLSMADVDRNVRRVLELILKTPRFKGYPYSEQPDLKAHASVTREAAAEGMILLKNDGKTLPLAADVRDIAVFGNTSYQFIAGGTGSGDVEEAYSVSLEEGLTGAGFILDKGLKQHYLDYIRAEEAKIDWKKYNHVTPPRIVECTLDEGLIRRKAEETDMAMITIGRNAGEYSDRKVKDDFELCADEREMLEKVTRIFHQEGKKVVVILNIGGVIETASWKDRPDAILLAWQGGQEGGNSVADILSGKVNPSGKLPMTFPVRYEDAASSETFPLIGDEEALDIYREFYTGPKGTDRPNIDFTRYEEGIYVGYRYFDKYRVDVSYPFGFGLSYTGFTYSKPRYLRTEQGYEFSCTVTNTGKIPGKEVVQLYIAAPGKTMVKPQKELKAFAKTKILAPGEGEVVRLVVGLSELASFDEQASCWAVESGRYLAIWGSSSRDCRLKQSFTLRQAVTGEEVHRVLLPVRQLEELY